MKFVFDNVPWECVRRVGAVPPMLPASPGCGLLGERFCRGPHVAVGDMGRLAKGFATAPMLRIVFPMCRTCFAKCRAYGHPPPKK